jgi:phosphomannomutase
MGALRFDANGWQARVGSGFDADAVARLADALGRTWAWRYEGSTILVGYDGRRDSQRMALLAGEVIAASGMRVVVSQSVCPTPALDWAVAQDPLCVGGVMVTARRMPYEYGGIIVRRGDGGHIDSGFADAVERSLSTSAPTARGSVERADIMEGYLRRLAEECDTALVESADLRVVVDPLYGAGSTWASSLVSRVGVQVVPLHDRCVPDFRGLHPHAREPWVDECECAVRESRADLGIVLDGDCGHMAVVDGTGRMVSPHDLAPLALEHVVLQRGRRGRVVATVASSARIARQAERLDCDFSMVPVGFESVYRELLDEDVVLATEEGGGICIPSFVHERDALLTTLMLLELVAGTGESISALVDDCERNVGVMEYGTRDMRLDFGSVQRLRNMLPGMNPPEVLGMVPQRVSHADGLRLDLPDGSWLLLRPSRTQPVVRAVCEGSSTAQRDELLSFASSLCNA